MTDFYIDTDNQVKVTSVEDVDGNAITGATVTFSLYEDNYQLLESNSDAVEAGSEVRFESDGHGFEAGDTIRISGTANYDGEHTITAVDTGNDPDTFDITTDWVDESFDGSERVYKGIENGTGKTCTHDSGGNYYGVLPEDAACIEGYNYWAFIAIEYNTYLTTIIQNWRAVKYKGE